MTLDVVKLASAAGMTVYREVWQGTDGVRHPTDWMTTTPALARFAALAVAAQWIPCAERLPTEYGWVVGMFQPRPYYPAKVEPVLFNPERVGGRDVPPWADTYRSLLWPDEQPTHWMALPALLAAPQLSAR